MSRPVRLSLRRRPARLPLAGPLALLAAAQLIVSVDYSIVFVALPRIRDALGFTPGGAQWVVSAYTIAFGGLQLLGGRMADTLGRRRMFCTGLVLYAASSVLGMLATEPWMLVTARSVQGAGGALLTPSTLALINSLFRAGPERHRAFGVWSAAGAGGLSLGALVGGALTQLYGWPSIFAANVLLAGAAAVAGRRLLPPDPPPSRDRGFDVPGGLAVTGAATLLVYALVDGPQRGWAASPVPACGLAAALALAAFVVVEVRTRHPLMPLRLLTDRDLATATAVMFVFQGGTAALLYFLTLYFQELLGHDALSSGLAFLPLTVTVMIASHAGSRLLNRLGARAVLVGGQLVAAAGPALLIPAFGPRGSFIALLPGTLLFAAGNGVTFIAMFAVAGRGIAPGEQGVAAGMASTGRQIGSAVGLAALVAVATRHGFGDPHSPGHAVHGLRTGTAVLAGVCVAGALTALVGARPRARDRRSGRAGLDDVQADVRR